MQPTLSRKCHWTRTCWKDLVVARILHQHRPWPPWLLYKVLTLGIEPNTSNTCDLGNTCAKKTITSLWCLNIEIRSNDTVLFFEFLLTNASRLRKVLCICTYLYRNWMLKRTMSEKLASCSLLLHYTSGVWFRVAVIIPSSRRYPMNCKRRPSHCKS